ncbi:MAG: hypothetical protein V2I82_05425 [Halieaceae bacterium]|nr:hypothetical protein [Halieaceae bacterium]
MAFSGGLYLLGVGGETANTEVAVVDGGVALLADPSADAVSALLARAGVTDFSFETARSSGNRVYTRPTSKTNYVLEVDGDAVAVTRQVPDLQKRMIELHKGHGPAVFKTFQKLFAAGMLFIIITGVWLGLSADRLRLRTLVAVGSGALVSLALILA